MNEIVIQPPANLNPIQQQLANLTAYQDIFAEHRYAIIPGLIERPLVRYLWSYVHTKIASGLMVMGDKAVPDTPGSYGDPAMDGLMAYIRPRVEAASGLSLIPTYSYFRVYKHGDILRQHRDRPSCEVSISLSLGEIPMLQWPLWLENASGAHAAKLSPGDAVMYRGHELMHWREPFDGERLCQVFLHYVDRNGPHANQRFDGRPSLMRPARPRVKRPAPPVAKLPEAP